jgi:hypothetical protein
MMTIDSCSCITISIIPQTYMRAEDSRYLPTYLSARHLRHSGHHSRPCSRTNPPPHDTRPSPLAIPIVACLTTTCHHLTMECLTMASVRSSTASVRGYHNLIVRESGGMSSGEKKHVACSL